MCPHIIRAKLICDIDCIHNEVFSNKMRRSDYAANSETQVGNLESCLVILSQALHV